MVRYLPTCLILVASLGACTEPSEFTGVFAETTPIADDREYAYKLDLFRFGDEVGGVVRLFEIEGPADYQLNTRANPFVVESFCSYFGPHVVADGSIGFRIENGPDGEELLFRLSSLESEDRINAELTRGASVTPEVSEPLSFSMDRVSDAVSSSCIPQGALVVVAEFPQYRIEDYPDLSLAIASQWYVLSESERFPYRDDSVSSPVAHRTDEYYAFEVTVVFPTEPAGLTWPNDPPGTVRYSVGFLVLYNDGNRDGQVFPTHVGDEVLAVSLEYVVFFAAGSPEALEPSVAAVFDDISQVPTGWGLFDVVTEIDGQNATIISADWEPSNRVQLDTVNPAQPPYPILMPEEL